MSTGQLESEGVVAGAANARNPSASLAQLEGTNVSGETVAAASDLEKGQLAKNDPALGRGSDPESKKAEAEAAAAASSGRSR